jgi:hypothetical protein
LFVAFKRERKTKTLEIDRDSGSDDPIAAATDFLTGKFSLTEDLRREHREEARREQQALAWDALPRRSSLPFPLLPVQSPHGVRSREPAYLVA